MHNLLDGYKQNIEEIKNILSDKQMIGCGICQFDIEKYEWQRITELAYDFIIQPLPKQ